MTGPERYDVPLDDLVASAQVPVEVQVEEHEVRGASAPDDGARHLPGGVRPYGA